MGRDEELGIVFIDTHPSPLLLQITAVVFGHSYVRLE
jgi:hypothetical protein